jgi:hypothetical protein
MSGICHIIFWLVLHSLARAAAFIDHVTVDNRPQLANSATSLEPLKKSCHFLIRFVRSGSVKKMGFFVIPGIQDSNFDAFVSISYLPKLLCEQLTEGGVLDLCELPEDGRRRHPTRLRR